jgi:hypothetical protein
LKGFVYDEQQQFPKRFEFQRDAFWMGRDATTPMMGITDSRYAVVASLKLKS